MIEPLSTHLLSLREVARRTGTDVRTVTRWRDRDGLPVYSLSARRHAVLWPEFQEWLKARKIQIPTKAVMR